MKPFFYIILIASLFIGIGCSEQKVPNNTSSLNPFVGQWAWEKSDAKRSFSIKIYEKGDSLFGTYCGLLDNGAKMDCAIDSTDIAFAFKKTTDKVVNFIFQSYNENDLGKASLTREGEKLIWHIIDPPKTEHYTWNDAIMLKVTKSK